MTLSQAFLLIHCVIVVSTVEHIIGIVYLYYECSQIPQRDVPKWEET